MSESMQSATERAATDNSSATSKMNALWDNVASPAGYILAVSYPVLALSTGVRALYQLFLQVIHPLIFAN